jgi:hypothetical protein
MEDKTNNKNKELKRPDRKSLNMKSFFSAGSMPSSKYPKNSDDITEESTTPQKDVRGFKSAKGLLGPNDLFSGAKYVTKEYQDYGYRLALQLDDVKRKALYMKLAKNEKRVLLEKALRFAADYPNAKNKASIFMWKLKELRNELKEKGTIAPEEMK